MLMFIRIRVCTCARTCVCVLAPADLFACLSTAYCVLSAFYAFCLHFMSAFYNRIISYGHITLSSSSPSSSLSDICSNKSFAIQLELYNRVQY